MKLVKIKLPLEAKKMDIPANPGCYQFLDSKKKIIYIGKAANLKTRVLSYWQKSTNHSGAKKAMLKQVQYVTWIETETEIEALLLEANLIKKHQPSFNVLLRDDKRFSYIKISVDDEIPGVFVTRSIDKSGKYFGPFTGRSAVNETLKAIRKIWPYCTERKVKKKSCFYYQIHRCAGPCGGKVDIKEYEKNVIKPIILFLSGKKSQITKSMETEIKKLDKKKEKSEEEESRLTKLKFQLINMKKVLEHTRIISIAEKYTADVVELGKVLNLSKTPERIEGYDISNIFGQEAVGSMVVFNDGEPNKRQYRKFKIKIGEGQANDVGMLREVMERRLKNDWPLPDLIIIDGGKGQLNSVVRVMKKSDVNIPIIAIAKSKGLPSTQAPDRIFFPGEKKPLELPLASPALHIIMRVRDEAHRFAIQYHRQLRSKKLMKK